MGAEIEQATEVIADATGEEPKEKQPWYKQKRNIGIAAACVVVLIAGGTGAVVALNQPTSAAVGNVASSSSSSSSSSDSSRSQNKETEQKAEEATSDTSQSADQAAPNASDQTENSDSGNAASAGAEAGTPATAQATGSESQKTWVADYQQQWVPNVVTVVDQAAYDEQIPIYEQHDVTRCSYCGADITGNQGRHITDHLMDNIFASGVTKSEQVFVGYDIISHPAITHTEDQGHYENVAAGGHWE